MTKSVERQYREFTGHEPATLDIIDLPETDVDAWRLGQMTAIAYKTRRDGKTEHYIHEFKSGYGPDIHIANQGRDVYLTDMKARVTEKGFEDEPMPALLSINPHARGTRAKKKASPMAAKRRRKRKSNPVTPLRAAKANPAPRRRRRRSQTANLIPLRRRRSNPSARRGKFDLGTVAVNAGGQAIGGLITSIAIGLLPLPANLKTGAVGMAVKVGIATALGMAAAQYASPKLGENIASGGATLAIFDFIRGYVPENIPMGGFVGNPMDGFVGNPMNGFVDNPMGASPLIYQGEDGGWYAASDDMGAYTASMVAPDQSGPWNSGLSNFVNM